MQANKKVAVSDMLSACKVIGFQRQFPAMWPGQKKRGSFDHIGFSETFAALSCSDELFWSKYMCFIEYSRKMDITYGWTVQQSKVKWTFWKVQWGKWRAGPSGS